MIEALITASPEFMKARPPAEQHKYFEQALAFILRKVGEDNVFTGHCPHGREESVHAITLENRLSARRLWEARRSCLSGIQVS